MEVLCAHGMCDGCLACVLGIFSYAMSLRFPKCLQLCLESVFWAQSLVLNQGCYYVRLSKSSVCPSELIGQASRSSD